MTTPAVDDTACVVSWYDPRLGFPGDPIALNFPCDEEAFAVITFACMHEHIDAGETGPERPRTPR